MFVKKIYIAFLINSIIILIMGYRYFNYVTNINYTLAKIYYVTAFIGHFITIAAIPLLISLVLYFFSKKKTFSTFLFAILSIFSILLLKVDSLVYSQFRFHLSPFVFDMVFGKNSGDIFHLDTSNIIKIIATEPHRITKINKQLELFTITDEKLNILKDESVNFKQIQKAFQKVNRFYKK